MSPSHVDPGAYISSANLTALRTFLTQTLPSLHKKEQATYCHHIAPPCSSIPCPKQIINLLNTASQHNQPTIFAYLWDDFLLKTNPDARIPWESLRAAAVQGSIPLAEAFHARDQDCFNIVQPPAPHGRAGGSSQIKIAVRNDNFAYADFMLAKGADIDAAGGIVGLVTEALRSTADDEVVLKRVQFLVERGSVKEGGQVPVSSRSGSSVMGKGVLREAVGRQVVLRYLLERGGYAVEDVRDALVAAETEHQDDVLDVLKKYLPD